ncbi:MAG: DegV family protein [Clostridia bacterium]|nr:DegV family protein [Clostridia bacterium]
MSFKISSDSTCDLSEKIVKENDITLVCVTIILDGKEYTDTVDITAEQVIKFVDEKGILPKTAANSVDMYKDKFESLTADGSELIHFCISSHDSSSYNNAVLAAKEVKGVYVVDSLQLSSGQGLLIMKAIDYRKEGLSAKETFDKIEEIKLKARTSFVLDRLDFLHKGGRCSLVALIGAKLLKLHPHISMTNGSLGVKAKYQGNMIRSVTKYVEDLAAEYTRYDKTRCFITHSPCDQDIIDVVKRKVSELFDFDEVIETQAGTTVTSHCGKNTIGVLFIAE